jgi:hypothetical protein
LGTAVRIADARGDFGFMIFDFGDAQKSKIENRKSKIENLVPFH